jgi:hypothetical protein
MQYILTMKTRIQQINFAHVGSLSMALEISPTAAIPSYSGTLFLFVILNVKLIRSAFHFDTQPAGKSAWPGCRILDHLDGMHTLRVHPMPTIPPAGVNWLSLARDIANSTVRDMVAKERCLAPMS